MAERQINGDVYCDMQELYVFQKLDSVESEQELIFFQQYGFPLQDSNCVCATLDFWFPNRWIGKAGSLAWLPSTDMTTLIYFFGHNM